ncbi:MAG: ArsR/SmtB family transcription factor [Candidatus Baldrarchaeia archaeon]
MDRAELCLCLESLAQITRIELIDILKERGMTIKEMLEKTKLNRTLLTYHIAVLERAGIVNREYIQKDNKVVAVYKLDRERLKEILDELRKIVE